ncbi:MAG TPA: hypothetical protein PK286_10410, partial [Devosia sp.]|nr:hypothetical protein [Devosia sp.]
MRVNAEWVRSAAARRILVHWADPRPAWLWSADGGLLWRNAAALLFGAKLKKSGLRLAPDAEPIRGTVPRLIRLGSSGRSSLSRIQFLAGGRAISTTCTVTPLELADGQAGALLVGVDAIDPDITAAAGLPGAASPALFPAGSDYLLLGSDGRVRNGTPGAREHFAPLIERGISVADGESLELDGRTVTLTRFKASPGADTLLLFAPAGGQDIESVRAEEGMARFAPAQGHAPLADEPLLPMGLAPIDAPSPEPIDHDAPWIDEEPLRGERLSSLFDRLASHETLYDDLKDDETGEPPPAPAAADLPGTEPDAQPPVPAEAVASEPAAATGDTPAHPLESSSAESPDAVSDLDESAPEAPTPDPEPDFIAAVIEFENDLAADPSLPPTPDTSQPPPDIELPPPPADPEQVERVSRYNFDELGRLLADRVAGLEPRRPSGDPVVIDPPIEPSLAAPVPSAVAEGALINIAAETFVLNRLPLGILVFRDQQVLFANRALTDLVGHETVEGLRATGIAAIFPADDTVDAGPVTHLIRRDGSRFPVTARLQSITWQGRPALMLSASPAAAQQSHESAVRAFAELAATTSADGYLQADRHGVVTAISDSARATLRGGREAVGHPLAALIYPDDLAAFRAFLDQPARFAETARPAIVLRSVSPEASITLFAEGQAGIVAGYFGFVRLVRAKGSAPLTGAMDDGVDPA